MRDITPAEPSAATDAALTVAQKEPVVIRDRVRDYAVLVSVEEFQTLHTMRVGAAKELARQSAREARARGLDEASFEKLMADVS